MGIKSSLKKVGKALGSAIGLILKPVTLLLSALLPKPKIPKSVEDRGTAYNADARFNESRIGDIKPIGYGQYRCWFTYASMPYKEFRGHDQFLLAYLHVRVGPADVGDFKLGDTGAVNFPGFNAEVLQPGEDMTLILPNVYTCPEVEGIELLGGLYEQDTASGTVGPWSDPDTPHKVVTIKAYEDGTTTISVTDQTFASDTEEMFVDFQVGDVVRVYDAGANNGDYTITAILDDYKTIQVDPAPATNTTQTDIGYFVVQRWAGPFPACPAGATVDTIAIDVIFNALRDLDNGSDNTRLATIKIQYREINDAGIPLDPSPTGWTEDEVTYIDSVNRVRRYTTEFEITPARVEVRVWRETYEQADQEDPSSAAQWVGLKGYIVAKPGDTPASDPDCTRIAVEIRSSGMLSGTSERALNGLVRAKVPIYESGGWSAPQFTDNPAWCAADWMLTQSNGAITEDQLDAAAFVESAATAEANGDTFNAEFDREVGLWEGAQTILRVCRSKPIWNPLTQLYGIYRDEPSGPVVMLCDGFNTKLGADSINLPDADTFTGIQVTFIDPLLWQEREGPLVGTDVDPDKQRQMGLTTWDASWREANYQIRDMLYRNHSVSAETEMDGLLPIHGNRVLVASAAKGWGHSGEVKVEADTTTLQVWPAPQWTAGQQHYVYLQDEDGTPVGPINVTQGGADSVLVLESDPGITIRTGGGWKTLFAFGHDGDVDTPADAPRIAIVMERSANSSRTATLNLLFDHPYVHEYPGPAPEDPYATDGEIPNLEITGLTVTPIYSDVITDELGEPILDEDGEPLIVEGGAYGLTLDIDWDDVVGASYYQLRWRYIGNPWHAGYTGIASETVIGINPAETGTIRVNVKAISGPYVGAEATTTVDVVAPLGSP